jgi:hypothetical protein
MLPKAATEGFEQSLGVMQRIMVDFPAPVGPELISV